LNDLEVLVEELASAITTPAVTTASIATPTGSEDEQNDKDVNDLEVLGIVSKLISLTIPWISHNGLVIQS